MDSAIARKNLNNKKDTSHAKKDIIHPALKKSENNLLKKVLGNIKNYDLQSVENIVAKFEGMGFIDRNSALMELQQTHGNQYVQRVLGAQAKLKIGESGDIYEQEADRVAEQVMEMPKLEVQHKYPEDKSRPLEDENKKVLVQLKTNDSTIGEISSQDDLINDLGSGQPLNTETRDFMELHWGHDFGQVKVHNNSYAAESAQLIDAMAYTVGKNVIFGSGQYNPHTNDGKKLLAHELAHVVQQSRNKHKIQRRTLTMPYATSTIETGPVWNVMLQISGAPEDDTEELQDFIDAINDGVKNAIWSFGTGSGTRTRNITLILRYHQKFDYVSVSNEAFSAARRSVLGKTAELESKDKPVEKKEVKLTGRNELIRMEEIKIIPNMVSTLCNRDFTIPIPGWVARHCFVWGHMSTIEDIPANIKQNAADNYTITYDNLPDSGRPDPEPIKATRCTKTFDVDPEVVREQYKRLCYYDYWNLSMFNCCTCAYMALKAAGASPTVDDFPEENQGIGLPFGGGLKKNITNQVWFNDIDDLEDSINYLLDFEILSLDLSLKANWIKKLISGVYCTESEGKIVIRLFQNTMASDRARLYQMVEGHSWTGKWQNGAFVDDDDMVDALSNKHLNILKDIINGLE